jgi:DNA-binding transcriptional ArsR family regulator
LSEWVIDIDQLASGRFQASAMIETASALATLAGRGPAPGLERWADAHRPAYQARFGDDPFASALVEAAFQPHWTAGIVVIPPQHSDRTFYDELRHVQELSVTNARRGLSINGSLPRPLQTPDLPARAADVLEWVWAHTLRADWPRRQQLLEADIVSRTQRLADGGWAAAMSRMRDDIRWLGDGRLRISADDYPSRDITGAELMFIPSTKPPVLVTWARPHRYAIVYPCAGMLADAPTSPRSRALARLIGPARTSLLDWLTQPRSTSQLVALTGYSLGSVGGHLRILLDAELVQRRRSGRSVLYYRTALGESLIARPESRPTEHGDRGDAKLSHQQR